MGMDVIVDSFHHWIMISENAEWIGWGVVWTSRGYMIPFFSGGDILNLNLKNNERGTLAPLFG